MIAIFNFAIIPILFGNTRMVTIMPNMRVHKSGGIVFIPTPAEKELRNIKESLKEELDSVRAIKEELLRMKDELGVITDAKNKG